MKQKELHPAWRVVGAAETGRSHIREGKVCQDKICILTRNGVTTAALADGCGSARLPELGAEAVTRRICQLFCDRFEEFMHNPAGAEVKQEILRQLYEVLDECCRNHGCVREDLASTLLAVALRGDSYLMLHIGDGVIGYVKEGRVRVASVPDNGEFANETTFVTAPDAFVSLRIAKGRNGAIEGFVLMSDGCEASLYKRADAVLAPILARQVYRLGITSEEYFQSSLEQSLAETISHQTTDDCSMILAAKVLRSYWDLDEEELDDYFMLEQLHPQERPPIREGCLRVLDLLDRPRTAQELTEEFGNGFEADRLELLVQLGYIRLTTNDTYVRLVGAPEADSMEIQNEEEHYEES